MDLYTVVTRRDGVAAKVVIAAESAEAAAAEAGRRGLVVERVLAPVWTGAGDAGHAAADMRCRSCAFPLGGLAMERGWVTCPECGLRQGVLG